MPFPDSLNPRGIKIAGNLYPSLKWAENLTTYLCSQKHKENLTSLENNEEELATLGTIHILRQHIFGPFLTHPSTLPGS